MLSACTVYSNRHTVVHWLYTNSSSRVWGVWTLRTASATRPRCRSLGQQVTRLSLSTLFSDKNTHSHFLLYLRGKCFDLYKISGYVCEELYRLSIEVEVMYLLLLLSRKHFIKCLSSTVKPIIYKDINMTSELRHQQTLIFNFDVRRICNSSQTYSENFV